MLLDTIFKDAELLFTDVVDETAFGVFHGNRYNHQLDGAADPGALIRSLRLSSRGLRGVHLLGLHREQQERDEHGGKSVLT